MARKPTGNPTGRPRKEIDEKQFKNACAMQATLEEIAGFFDCDEDTVNAWCKRTYGETFSVVYKKFSAPGKMSLRRYQFELAKKSAAMAIFLGKNMLGQTDKIEQTVMEVEDLSSLAEMLRTDAPATQSDDQEA